MPARHLVIFAAVAALVIGTGCASCPPREEARGEVTPLAQCVEQAPEAAAPPPRVAEAPPPPPEPEAPSPPPEEGRGAPPPTVAPAPAPEAAPPPPEEGVEVAPGPAVRAAIPLGPTPPGVYRVQPGDSLWDISTRAYDDPMRWRDIFEANREVIDDPNLIYPNQELQIPG